MIAVVDDDAATCQSLERLLRCHGFASEGFTSAAAFLASQHLRNTDCLLLDVRMPEQNGLELQDYLRAEGHRIPIIFITGLITDEIRDRVSAAGAVSLLEKPFDHEVLIQNINHALAGASQ